jgi:hypothetical protein
MVVLASLLAMLLFGGTLPAETTGVETWVGHQILRGQRRLPIYGDVPVETQNYVIAKVQHRGNGLEFRQSFCRVEPQPIDGVTVALSSAGVARMPASILHVDAAVGGRVSIAPWNVGWASEDMDGDGKPGATFTVSGTVCSGEIYVASQSHYIVDRARLDVHGLSGELRVEQKQHILAARGLCLRLMAGDSTESQHGTFAYAPVLAGTTCQSLAGKPWPVRAERQTRSPAQQPGNSGQASTHVPKGAPPPAPPPERRQPAFKTIR